MTAQSMNKNIFIHVFHEDFITNLIMRMKIDCLLSFAFNFRFRLNDEGEKTIFNYCATSAVRHHQSREERSSILTLSRCRSSLFHRRTFNKHSDDKINDFDGILRLVIERVLVK